MSWEASEQTVTVVMFGSEVSVWPVVVVAAWFVESLKRHRTLKIRKKSHLPNVWEYFLTQKSKPVCSPVFYRPCFQKQRRRIVFLLCLPSPPR